MPILIADKLPKLFLDALGSAFDVRPLEPNPLEADLAEAVGIIAYAHPAIDAALMDRMPNLKAISNHGVGVDHIEVAAAVEREIPVGNTPGCLDAATADMTMTLMLSVARNVVIGDRYARSVEFTHYDPSLLIGKEVSGSTLGIVGMGRIGTEVARRAAGFGMKILYFNRNRRPEVEHSLGVEYRDFESLLKESDFVSLNCPLTEETTGLMGQREFELMKSDAVLINMARGPVADTDALFEALRDKTIAAAGLDVTDPEPLPRDHALLTLDNVIITPHLGSASDGTRRRMMELTLANLNAALTGEPLPHEVRSN